MRNCLKLKGVNKLNLNLPIQTGYFILQYAKLHMLQFYYDFTDIYVKRADFDNCEIDIPILLTWQF